MKKKLLSIALAITSIAAIAQRDANLYFLPTVQSTKLNPAFIPEAKTVLGITGLSGFGIDATLPFAYSDLYVAQGDSFKLDFNKVINEIEETGNVLSVKTDIDLFRLGFRMGPKKKTMFTLNVTEKIQVGTNIPKSLFEFLGSDKNSNDLNISLSGMGLDFTHYREYGFTFARDVNDKLNVGLGLKLLYGKGNLNASKTDISISSSTTNGFNATNQMLINSSGFNVLDSNVTSYAQIVENTGFAFDIGGTYKATEKLELSLSVLDIGAGIEWTNDIESISADNSFNFKGANLSADTLTISESLDSLVDVFDLDTVSVKKNYKTTLPTKVYFSGAYKISDKFNAGGLLYLELGDKTLSSVSLVAEYKVSRMLSASLSYSAYNGTFSNIGAGLVFNGGPFQLYLTSDNLLGFNVYGTKGVNFRFGTNFQFGRTDKKVKSKKIEKNTPAK